MLLVKLHLTGFYWGDVSLSNTLFRRDAGAFAAYLVDAETGELYDELTPGQRNYDLDLARTNIAGELMDVVASEALEADLDEVIAIADRIVSRYHALWSELTEAESFEQGRPLARGGPHPPPQRPRLRRRRARRSPPTSTAPPSASSRRSSTRGTTPGGCCA